MLTLEDFQTWNFESKLLSSLNVTHITYHIVIHHTHQNSQEHCHRPTGLRLFSTLTFPILCILYFKSLTLDNTSSSQIRPNLTEVGLQWNSTHPNNLPFHYRPSFKAVSHIPLKRYVLVGDYGQARQLKSNKKRSQGYHTQSISNSIVSVTVHLSSCDQCQQTFYLSLAIHRPNFQANTISLHNEMR